MATPVETEAMRRAIALAAAGTGRTNPNPVVGAVVLDAGGAVVGEGGHERAGGPHAEILALQAAGDAARGGTMVVTLEPCRHTGRTGPCTQAILAAGVSRVVYGVGDPFAAAAGGAEELRGGGVDVEGGVLLPEAEAVNERWLAAVRRGRPYVLWKYAATLDGRTAAADGTSRWITGPEARRDVHALRLACDAVVVGIGTVLADDPELTVRAVDAPRQPTRVVVDTHARTPTSSRLLDGAAPTLVMVGADAPPARVKALRDTAAEVVEMPVREGRVDLVSVVAALYEREALILLLEGGARLASGFLRARLVDRVVGYVAPALLGAGPLVLADTGIPTIGQALRLEVDDVARVGVDVRISAHVARKGG